MIMFLSGLALFLCAIATVAIFVGLVNHNTYVNQFAIFVMGFVLVLISIILGESFISEVGMQSMRSWYLLPLAWFLIALAFLGYFCLKQYIFFLTISPLSFVVLFTSFIFPEAGQSANAALTGPIFWVHLSLVFLGIGFMALSAGAAGIFLWQERALKKKMKLSALPSGLPSILALDKVNAIATAIGFPLYLLGVLSGFSWAYISWGVLFSGDPKEILSLIILILYAYLFYQRLAQNSYGKKPAMLAILIFLASLFSIMVINTLFSTHHSFLQNISMLFLNSFMADCTLVFGVTNMFFQIQI